MQSVLITTKVLSLNPAHGEVYSIQQCVVCQLLEGGQWFSPGLEGGQWFSPGTQVSSANKTDHHDITELLLKVVLNTVALILLLLYPPQQSCRGVYWFHHVRPSVRPSVDKSYVVR